MHKLCLCVYETIKARFIRLIKINIKNFQAQQFLSRSDAEGVGFEVAHACLVQLTGADWLRSENVWLFLFFEIE
jgi:hypothetical protein